MNDEMTSRERVIAAITHKNPDRTPAAFEAVESVTARLLKHYGFSHISQLYDRFGIDIAYVTPDYIGPPLKTYQNPKGEKVEYSYWGYASTYHTTAVDTYPVTTYFPLDFVQSLPDLDAVEFPNPDWFDYESVKRKCALYKDKAIVAGHEGPFQIVTFLMNMEDFFLLMLDSPETAHAILDKMVDFELEYYERILQATGGRIDILRPHDDYGTQLSLLFSMDMWREFFEDNTKRLVNLAHKHGAFYQQHSCGAIAPLIPKLIECGVDVLEPLQKLPGLEPETLAEKYRGKIAFHGGIDTQTILPFGTPDEVVSEAEKYMRILNPKGQGGYILTANQAFEGDVPVANIEALYAAKR